SSRGDQASNRLLRTSSQCLGQRLTRQVAGELAVNPQWGLQQVRQLCDRALQDRQWPGRVDQQRCQPLLDPDQHDPRPQTIAGRYIRREQPWEVGAIELDAGQQMRWEIGRQVTRLGTHDLTLVDADDIPWTVGLERYGHVVARRAAEADLDRQ